MKSLFFFTIFLFTAGLSAEEALDFRIPVVDMLDYNTPEKREAFLDTLSYAMKEVGFFAVLNAGVHKDIIHKAYTQAQEFFKQDPEIKNQSFFPTLNGQRGFVPGETAKGNQAKDCKEFYHIGRELSLLELDVLGIMPNVWPENPEFKEAMVSIYKELDRYTDFLFEAIIEVINRESSTKIPSYSFADMTLNSLLRALYYPALPQEKIGNFCWAAAHTDIDLLAILPYATERGLQVQLDGQWLTVVVPEDAFIVNVGDMLENMTNGLFVSARHRVVALEAGKERFSMVFFVHPPDVTALDPLPACIEQTGGIQKYAPGTRQEFLWERLLELNIAPGLLVPYSQMGHVERQAAFGRQSPQVIDMLIERNLASPELLQLLNNEFTF